MLPQTGLLLEEETGTLNTLMRLNCDPLFSSFCVTPFKMMNTSPACQELAKYVKDPTKFLYYSLELTHEFFQLDQVRAEVLIFDSLCFEKV